jgi:hypothetical protein
MTDFGSPPPQAEILRGAGHSPQNPNDSRAQLRRSYVPLVAPAVGVTQAKEAIMTKLPPDPEGKNDDRAAWAMTALSAFERETGTDEQHAVADLLCDLMHLYDRKGWDFDADLERARDHYTAETLPDTGDLLAAARLVIQRWPSGDLAEAVRRLEAAVNLTTAEDA